MIYAPVSFTLELAVIFRRFFIALFFIPLLSLTAQENDTMLRFTAEDSLQLMLNDSLYKDSFLLEDTIYYGSFVPYDKVIWRNSKINLRKTLSASKNPPFRRNLNNYAVLIWGLLITLLIIFFKSNFALQYRLLNKSWYNNISFNEFFSTQTSVFKNSKILTWFIISQCIALGIFIVIKSTYSDEGNGYTMQSIFSHKKMSDFELVSIISALVVLLCVANQWLKNVFAYSFYQPSLSKDYAIIYRIHSYIASLFLVPVLLLLYYNGAWNLKAAVVTAMIVYILVVYASSLVKFIFSGRFLQNQSNFILFLYLCAFEILPLLVLIKSINNLLEYD